ncbi:hypothetical protein CFOL_v3_25176 [Cephalotus follicularis]|uniref:Uncharacterized protein n=1 Tax=Cephalotus follicularis TaxID=3775 RepID=A0A1Q3CNM5_CEPFO|nr:hypothetical protein CFOL_v3_25176 [Cephalotus follicularis]
MPGLLKLLSSSPELLAPHPAINFFHLNIGYKTVRLFIHASLLCSFSYINALRRSDHDMVLCFIVTAYGSIYGSKLTLLYWILHVSKDVCASSGYRCFKQNNKLPALSAKTWFLSVQSMSDMRSFTIAHDDLVWLMHALRLHVYIEASTRSASSSASCSDAMLRQSRR